MEKYKSQHPAKFLKILAHYDRPLVLFFAKMNLIMLDGASVGYDTWPPANAIYQPSDNHILGKTYPHKDFSLLSQIIYKLFVKS